MHSIHVSDDLQAPVATVTGMPLWLLAAAMAVASATVAAEPLPPAGAHGAAAQLPLEEIIVTASLRDLPLGEMPSSTTVIPAHTLEAAAIQHFGDVLGLVPNLNWSGGSSRPRYFQMRGVGELEQYQGAPNPSVGFLIDEIDLSGVGMPATTFDAQQVEVLRGPQGTRYGANALAGLIKIRTRDATPESDLRAELTGGGNGTWSAGVAVGGALGEAGSAWRLAAQKFASDGFQENSFLDRDDTNGRDETTVRAKWHLQAPAGWSADVSGLSVDLDNGYDAFSLDNSRTTLSDRPGRDAQRTHGASIKARGPAGDFELASTTAYAQSDIVYSFDGDWGNDPYWGEFAPYDYFSHYDRARSTLSQDLKLHSPTSAPVDWVAGVYLQRLAEDSVQSDYFAEALTREPLASEYVAHAFAAYGEAEWPLAGSLALTTGLRVETRSARYDDSDGAHFDPRETMVGGNVSLQGPLAPATDWYATVSRGYKAGGFNIGQAVPDDRRQFDAEFLWNAEAGLRGASPRLGIEGQLAVFHMWREDQQVATSFQLDPGDPLSYVFYTDNAARGRVYGLETSGSWQPAAGFTLAATLGLLHSEYLGYRHGERDLDGREQAHAPGFQYSLSAQWQGATGWSARADLNGSDAFYFDASHDRRSQPYTLLNIKAGYARGHWAAYAWVRNVANADYAVRGFYFGLEPPAYANELYVQRGDARLVGGTLLWRW